MAGLQMQGCLLRYGKEEARIAFKSGQNNKHVILIGGLGDGLLSLSYAPPLADTLESIGWSLIQAQLSSSYTGYGIASLDQDAEEIHELVKHIIQYYNSEAHVLIGHSTGCQDSVRYVKNYGNTEESKNCLKGVILQAPVSDREEFLRHQEYVDLLPKAVEAVQNDEGRAGENVGVLLRGSRAVEAVKNDEGRAGENIGVLLRSPEGVPITATRLLSFLQRKGDDDMFSSDFSDQELKELLGHMSSIPNMIVQSGSEEFVPESVNVAELGQRFAYAMGPNSTCEVIEGGNHALYQKEQQFCEIVKKFVNSLK